MKKESRPLPLRKKLTVAAAIDYPTASEIVVSFADQWELVSCVRRQTSFYENIRLYVAAFPPSQERSQPNHFIGLSPEINRSLTSYRLYKLFEPWPQPIFPILARIKNALQFAKKIREGLAKADGIFAKQRGIIEALDVKVTLDG